MKRGQYFQSNRKTRVYLDAIAELIRKRGLLVALRMAGLHAWVDELPPLDDELAVDCINITALNHMIVLMYGPHGGGSVLMRAGRTVFRDFVVHWEDKLKQDDLLKEVAPQRLPNLLDVLVKNWNLQCSGIAKYSAENDETFLVQIVPCLDSIETLGERIPNCYATVGFLQEAIEWADLGDFYKVAEISKRATTINDGNEDSPDTCIFEIIKYE